MSDKAETTRMHIVETATRLFYQRGYNQTSFSDIAMASKVPRGNFYYYFRTKDDILLAVIEARAAATKAILDDWNEKTTSPLDRIRMFIQMFRDNKRNMMRFGCPMGSLNMELGKAQKDLKAEAKMIFDLFRVWLARQFTELGNRDNADDLALHMLGRIQGIVVISHVYSDTKIFMRELDLLDSWLANLAKPHVANHASHPVQRTLKRRSGR